MHLCRRRHLGFVGDIPPDMVQVTSLLLRSEPEKMRLSSAFLASLSTSGSTWEDVRVRGVLDCPSDTPLWLHREPECKGAWDLAEGHRGAVCVLSRFSRVGLFATAWMVARYAPLSMAFSRREYWSGLPCKRSWGILSCPASRRRSHNRSPDSA